MRFRMTRSGLLPVTVIGALLLSGCTGGDGASGDSESASQGFSFGAEQSIVDEAVADLEPVSIVYQPSAQSANQPASVHGLAVQEYIEERSNGKIEVEMVWGQAIAGHTELETALADGRVDLGYLSAIYSPDDFPTVDALTQLTHYAPSDPIVGEAVSFSMMTDYAWQYDEHIESLEKNGLTALSPIVSTGDYWIACNEPGSSLEDFEGRQIRIVGSGHTEAAEAIGAVPVSMEFAETYEALQRGTVDCTFVQPQVAGSTGLLEIAPYVSHFDTGRMTGSITSVVLAGSSFNDLPLAYQQIIFDSGIADFDGSLQSTMNSGAKAASDAKGAGGGFEPFEAETEEALSDSQEAIVDNLMEEGRLPGSIREDIESLSEKWADIVGEMDYVDEGSWSTFDDWYSTDSSYSQLAERVMEETALSHRPE